MQPMNPLLLTDTIDVEEAKESVSALGTWLSNFTQTALSFLVRLGIAIVIYLIVSKVLKKVLQHLTKWLEKKNTDPSVSHFMIAAIKYTVLVFTVVMIIVKLDIVEASSIAALIASAGVAISLALQGVLSNLAGGILILILRPFREGDYIVVKDADVEGTVERIEIYYTTIRTLLGGTVSIPNSALTGNAISNVAHGGMKGICVKVGISYDADIEQVKTILWDILKSEKRLDAAAYAKVCVEELGDSAVVLSIRSICRAEDYYEAYWALNETIRTRFQKEGIEIPYNQLDVHMIGPEKEKA